MVEKFGKKIKKSLLQMAFMPIYQLISGLILSTRSIAW